MSKIRYSNILFSWGKWALTVCFALFLILTIIHDYRGAKTKRFNSFMFMPNTHKYLVDVAANRKEFNKARLRKFEFYFKMLIQQTPNRADAHGMLGFFSYHLGRHRQAVSSYKKAISLNPNFFWYHYNLGVIYFRKGDYENAIESVEKSIKISPKHSLMFILASKRLYLPIMAEYLTKSDNDTYAKWLGKGYRDSNELLILSHYYLKNYTRMFGIANYARNLFSEDSDIFNYYKLLAVYKLKGEPDAMSVSDDLLDSRKQAIKMSVF